MQSYIWIYKNTKKKLLDLQKNSKPKRKNYGVFKASRNAKKSRFLIGPIGHPNQCRSLAHTEPRLSSQSHSNQRTRLVTKSL
jgi:hypothetical protein